MARRDAVATLPRPSVVERPGFEVGPTYFRVERWYGSWWEPVAATFYLNVAAARWHREVTKAGHVTPVALRALRPEGHVLLAVSSILDVART